MFFTPVMTLGIKKGFLLKLILFQNDRVNQDNFDPEIDNEESIPTSF
jgi:hypothetical protein